MQAGWLYIDGQMRPGAGVPLSRADPATGRTVWQGASATRADVDDAVAAARRAAPAWADAAPAERLRPLEAFAQELARHKEDLAEAICLDTGKPRWEAKTEVDAMIAKVAISRQALEQRRNPSQQEKDGVLSATRFKPHGVLAVLGPFNFPGHVPNGHIVPALLAGNTVVFKPSELAPLTAQQTVQCWRAAGLPAGVINLVHGGRETGGALAAHPGVDGLLFTGSRAAGLALSRVYAEQPEKILALEMGGNNPLVVHQCVDLDAAAYLIVKSAFLTSGQRCTCARRLIVQEGPELDRLLERLISMMGKVRIGPHTAKPEPFMGPVITPEAAARLLREQDQLIARGGRPIVAMSRLGECPAMLAPGVIDVTAIADRPDEEVFGPLLQLVRAKDFDAAIREANRTRYGLCAGLLSDNRAHYEAFRRQVRAGVVNWNRPTTGASSLLPFGGVGYSGNHRPSAYFAADYSSYPVASLEAATVAPPLQPTPGIDL